MKTETITKKSKKERNKAAESLKWLLSKNPNVKRLVETFDLEISVNPYPPNL